MRNFFTLFKFICSYITKPTTPNDLNFARDELSNFPTKFDVKFTTSFRSSQFDWQLRNEIAKFVANFGNFKRTSETVCQKFCKTHCNSMTIRSALKMPKIARPSPFNGYCRCNPREWRQIIRQSAQHLPPLHISDTIYLKLENAQVALLKVLSELLYTAFKSPQLKRNFWRSFPSFKLIGAKYTPYL